MSTSLNVSDLVKNYGQVEAVKGVSFSVSPGEIFGLLGPNGAGKTSIISIIVTLEQPTLGHASVFGYDVVTHAREAKMRTGIVPQEMINHGFFSVTEVLRFISGYFGLRHNQERIDFLLNRLSLWDHRNKKVKELSGGMKRRLMIAKALVHSPKLLLLDEPTAGVDIELRTTLWEFVRELKKEGVSVLLTTHYLEEAENLCDRIAIMDHGEIKKIGNTKELVRSLTTRTVRFSIKQSLSPVQHKYLVSQSPGELEFCLPSEMGLGDLLNELRFDPRILSDIKIVEGDLSDAFRHVLGGSK